MKHRTYAEEYELLILAKNGRAESVTLDVEDEPVRFPVEEALGYWHELAPGDPFQVLSINYTPED